MQQLIKLQDFLMEFGGDGEEARSTVFICHLFPLS